MNQPGDAEEEMCLHGMRMSIRCSTCDSKWPPEERIAAPKYEAPDYTPPVPFPWHEMKSTIKVEPFELAKIREVHARLGCPECNPNFAMAGGGGGVNMGGGRTARPGFERYENQTVASTLFPGEMFSGGMGDRVILDELEDRLDDLGTGDVPNFAPGVDAATNTFTCPRCRAVRDCQALNPICLACGYQSSGVFDCPPMHVYDDAFNDLRASVPRPYPRRAPVRTNPFKPLLWSERIAARLLEWVLPWMEIVTDSVRDRLNHLQFDRPAASRAIDYLSYMPCGCAHGSHPGYPSAYCSMDQGGGAPRSALYPSIQTYPIPSPLFSPFNQDFYMQAEYDQGERRIDAQVLPNFYVGIFA